MGIYECTVYERPQFGDSKPVETDGAVWSREIVAESAGRARYSYWRDVHEFHDQVRLTDIRVRSLNRQRRSPPMVDGWASRMKIANAIIMVIAAHGRHFLSENSDRREPVADPFIAHFRVDKVGELWYIDRHTRKSILVRHEKWPGFSDGGTLRGIIGHLAIHIADDEPVNPGYFGVSPGWTNDHWGYGHAMARVADGVMAVLAGASHETP